MLRDGFYVKRFNDGGREEEEYLTRKSFAYTRSRTYINEHNLKYDNFIGKNLKNQFCIEGNVFQDKKNITKANMRFYQGQKE